MSSNKEIVSKAIENACDLESIDEYFLYDIENFKRELKRANLMSDALDEFIENYMRFDNN